MPLVRRVAGVAVIAVTWLAVANCSGGGGGKGTPASPVTPTPPPTPSGPAIVRLTTDSLTCFCTVGGPEINVRIDGVVAGQTMCNTPERDFTIQSGARTIEPCDTSGECWTKKTVTIGPNETYVYPVTCKEELAGFLRSR